MIRAVQPASKWKLLVVDAQSAKLLNVICKSHEILEENVTLIEEMHRKRQTFPNYEAIYFVTASEKTVDRIIMDFSSDKPLYLAAHIYFTATLADALFEKIRGSGILKYVKTLKDMNIDFIGTARHILWLLHLHILSMLVTMGECPYIRYHDPSGVGSGLCAKLALLVQHELEELRKVDDSFPPKTEFKPAILIIVDRSFDMMAPLLHEFTYQAMMADLLNGEGVTSPSYASLDENDPIWNLIKHWHFADAVEYIRNSFKQFLTENKAAAAAAGNGPEIKGLEGLKAMKDTMSSLPEFQETKAKDLATGEDGDGKPLRDTGMYSVVPVMSNKGPTPYDKLRTLLIYVISQSGINDLERRRLIDLGQIPSDDAQAVTNLSFYGVQLAKDDEDARGKKTKPIKDKDRYSYWGSHKLDKKRRKNKPEDDVGYHLSRYVPLVKRVIEDQIANVIPKDIFPWVSEPSTEQIGILNDIVPKMFRFTSNGLVAPDPNYPHSLRTTRTSWVNRKPGVKTSGTKSGGANSSGTTGANSSGAGAGHDSPEKGDLRRNGPRVILFVLGGLTYSEMRSVYEITRDTQREVYIGSTFVYNPSLFVDVLKSLHKSDPGLTAVGQLYGAKPMAEDAADGKGDAGAASSGKEPKERKGIFSTKKK
eukprot:jgi/Hompol1/5595/HPOL_004565-RA